MQPAAAYLREAPKTKRAPFPLGSATDTDTWVWHALYESLEVPTELLAP